MNNVDLDVIWGALWNYREKCIPEGILQNDQEWSDICTHMAWIAEGLGIVDNDQEDEYDILDTDYGFMAYNITIDEYLHDDYGNNTFDTYKEAQDLIDKEIAK